MSIAVSTPCFLASESTRAKPVRKPISSRTVGLKALRGQVRGVRRAARVRFATRAEEVKTAEVTEEVAATKGELVDPADGSVAYGAPLGEKGTENLNNFWSIFKDPRSTEILNGRAAMIGFSAAIWFELTKGTSLVNQVFNVRTFTLLDGNKATSTLPGAGFYLAVVTVFVVVVASYFPKAKGVEQNGLDKEPGSNMNSAQLPRFNADIEMFNGRAAMVGLVALAVTEAILGRAEF